MTSMTSEAGRDVSIAREDTSALSRKKKKERMRSFRVPGLPSKSLPAISPRGHDDAAVVE